MALARTVTNVTKVGLISSASFAGADLLAFISSGAGFAPVGATLTNIAAIGEGLPLLGGITKAISAATLGLSNTLAGVFGYSAANALPAIVVAMQASPLLAIGVSVGVLALGVAAVWGISKWLNKTGDKIDHNIEEKKLRAQQQSQERAQVQEQSRGTSPTTERIAQQQYDFGPDHPALKAEQNGKVWTQSAALPPHQQISSPSLA